MTRINRTVLHESVPTISTFTNGGTVRTSNDLFKTKTNTILFWSGEVPKKVPANSTPESTGGIGDGAWVQLIGETQSVFATGGELLTGDTVKYNGDYYTTVHDVTVLPSTKPSDYPDTFINLGTLVHSPDYSISNFKGTFHERFQSANSVYGRVYIPKGVYELDTPILVQADTYVQGENGTVIKWVGETEPTIPNVTGRVGVFDVVNENASYSIDSIVFETSRNIPVYVNVLRGFVKSVNCVFSKGADYPVVKNSSRVHNGYNSLDGEMLTDSCGIYTKYGVVAYAKGSTFYKEDNKTKNRVVNCTIDCPSTYDTSVGFGYSEFSGNVVRDSTAPYYNLPVYYLQTDTDWKVTSGSISIDRNYLTGTGSVQYKHNKFTGKECNVFVVCDSTVQPRVDSKEMEQLRDGVYTISTDSFQNLTLNVTGSGSVYRVTILAKSAKAMMYTAYADYQVCCNNKFLNVNRAMTSGIDARNITFTGNYTLGGRCLTIDTVSYNPSPNVFEHNVATTDVSGNLFECSIDSAWITGSSVSISNNRFQYCGYFGTQKTAVAVNTDSFPNSSMGGVVLEGNTFIGSPSRLLRVTSGTCVVGTNYHDSSANLDSVSIYQASSGGKVLFSVSQSTTIDDSEFTLNDGFGLYNITSTGTVTVKLPSRVYHLNEMYEGTIVVPSTDTTLQFKTVSGSASINGKSSEAVTGKLMYRVVNTGGNNYLVQ